ncbi:hypothetical protein NKH43_25680 [Mesorhizobium sp. M1163]
MTKRPGRLSRYRRRRRIHVVSHNRGDKAVAAARDIDDIPRSVLAVLKGPAQRCHVDPDARFIDDYALPYEIKQLVPADNVAGTLYQGDQEIQRTGSDPHRLAIPQQQPAGNIQAEAAERHNGAR